MPIPVLQPGERIEIYAGNDDNPDGDWIEWVFWGRTDVFKGLSGTMALAAAALGEAIAEDRADATSRQSAK